MRVVFMGTPEFSVPALEALHGDGHDIVAVYSQPPRKSGRGQQTQPTPVARKATELGLEVRTPFSFQRQADIGDFEALDADVAVVVAYGLILPQALLDAPHLGCLNIHASLLPRWRGAAPIHRAIMAGDGETGVCIMAMEAGLDTGPVLKRVITPIHPTDTTGTLHDRLSKLGAHAVCDVLPLLPMVSHPQPQDGVTYASKINKAEARINWSRPAAEVDRQIRGLAPFPGAWFELGGERIKVLMSEVTTGSGTPGTALGDPLTIACGEGAVRLLSLQRAGKSPMDAKAFLNGFSVEAGAALG